jgi:hypothetical protein
MGRRVASITRGGAKLAYATTLVLVLLSGTSAAAKESPAPVPSELYCPIAVAAAVPVKPDAIAFFLDAWRADGKKSSASGTLAVFIEDERYDVPFVDVIVAGREDELKACVVA